MLAVFTRALAVTAPPLCACIHTPSASRMARHAVPGAKWACSSHLRAGAPNRGLHTAASGLRLPWVAAPPPWSPLVHVHHPPLSVLHRGFGSAWRGEDRGTRRAQGLWAHGLRECPLWTRVVRLNSGICLAGARSGAPDSSAVSRQLSFPCGEQHPAAQCAADVQDGGRETDLYAGNTWNFVAERTAANVVVIESKVAGQ